VLPTTVAERPVGGSGGGAALTTSRAVCVVVSSVRAHAGNDAPDGDDAADDRRCGAIALNIVDRCNRHVVVDDRPESLPIGHGRACDVGDV
jgi:hypothetical protein